MIIKTWAFAKHFLKNEQSDLVPSRKTTDIFIANDKILPFKQKFKFWKLVFARFSTLKDFLMRLMVTLKM